MLIQDEPGTPEVDSKQLNQTKEIAALDSGEQTTVDPIPPQLEEDDKKVAFLTRQENDDMTEEPSFTAPEQPEETEQIEQIEDPPDPDTRPRIPIRITFQDGKNTRRKRKGPISLNYHSVRCSICNHPDREAIEQGYLHWENPTYLAHEYGLGRRRAVYRHAEALGLREKRGGRTRRSLEFVMEQAETVTATASDVIRAVRAYSCLSEDGQWTEPTKRAIITHEHVDGSSAPGSGPKLATRHSPLVTEFDGHTRPSKNAATPAPSTKVRKLMGTLFKSFGNKKEVT